jgi:tripartite-type tricarboxylate transporter receptor subunit TctC
VNHIGAEMLGQAYGLKFTYVPYKGVAPAVLDLVAGQVDLVMAGGLALADQAKSGSISILVHGDDVRAPHLPNVPTLQEAGGKPGIIPKTTFTMFAPAKVSDAMLAQMQQQVASVLANPEMKARYAARALTIKSSTAAATLAEMKSDAIRYQAIISAAGIKIE